MIMDSIELMLREYVSKLVDERVAQAIKNLDVTVKEHVTTAIDDYDFSGDVESILDKHDFDDDIESALDRYDFTKVIDDVIDDHDFSTTIGEQVTKIMEDARITITIPD